MLRILAVDSSRAKVSTSPHHKFSLIHALFRLPEILIGTKNAYTVFEYI